MGTFALALAFASNDLVNFIGVPLAFTSYQIYLSHPGAQPDTFLMGELAGDVNIKTYFLILAGVIMAATLWFSKKARSVTKTEVDLRRQHSGAERFNSTVLNCFTTIQALYNTTLHALKKESLKELKNAYRTVKQLNSDTKDLKVNLHQTISRLNEDPFESGSYYVQIIDDIRDMVHSITFIVKPSLDHVDNNHKGLTNTQFEEVADINKSLTNFFQVTRDLINSRSVFELDAVSKLQQELLETLEAAKIHQIRRIKKAEAGTKNSILYLAILQETKNLILITFSLLKSHRAFISAINK